MATTANNHKGLQEPRPLSRRSALVLAARLAFRFVARLVATLQEHGGQLGTIGGGQLMMYSGDNRKLGGPYASFQVNKERARLSLFGNSGETEESDGTSASLGAEKEYASLFIDGGPKAATAAVVAREKSSELKLTKGHILNNGKELFAKP